MYTAILKLFSDEDRREAFRLCFDLAKEQMEREPCVSVWGRRLSSVDSRLSEILGVSIQQIGKYRRGEDLMGDEVLLRAINFLPREKRLEFLFKIALSKVIAFANSDENFTPPRFIGAFVHCLPTSDLYLLFLFKLSTEGLSVLEAKQDVTQIVDIVDRLLPHYLNFSQEIQKLSASQQEIKAYELYLTFEGAKEFNSLSTRTDKDSQDLPNNEERG